MLVHQHNAASPGAGCSEESIMSWSDLPDVHTGLAAALAAYDWQQARGICQALIRRIHYEVAPCPESDAKAILAALRKKRRFELMTPVAEAFILSGQNAPLIRHLYAQALIEQGILVAPEYVVQTLAFEPLEDDSQVAEAHGLLGRIYKQRFLNAERGSSKYARLFFERALAEYLQSYRLDPAHNYWHGINVVALLRRGQAHGIAVRHAPDPDTLAREILETLRHASSSSDAFDLATKLEALVAVGDDRAAESAALEYSRHPDLDAFEVGSMLRQFEDVWRLTDETAPGATILPLLRAARLRSDGGSVNFTPSEVRAELTIVKEASSDLQQNFGEEKTVTLNWYETALVRTKSLARVERLNGKGRGTGWIVRAEDFFDGWTGPLLLTCAHVVNPEGTDDALAPDQAQAHFTQTREVVRFQAEVVWSSPPDKFDASFLAFQGAVPSGGPMPLSGRKVRLTVPPPRIYTMGHPFGRDVELSLHDNRLLGCSERLLHYRTPTAPGSSGSPLFEENAWEVIGLHHAGGTFPRPDGGTPPYEANEGIAILALQTATKRSAPASKPRSQGASS
jgi:hypothetical protein